MSVILIFVDGIGLGEKGEENPFTEYPHEAFEYMTEGQPFVGNLEPIRRDGHLFKPVDARLGVEGLPQSGTGQATLFSGANAARILGRHFGPYPHSEIKFLLKEQSLFHQAKEQGHSCYFMNAYPDVFFQRARKHHRWTCTTLMARSAGVALNREEDVREGKALTAEIVNQIWRSRLKIDLPEITAGEAADRVLEMSKEKDLILFEYFLTDKAGHAQDMKWAGRILTTLSTFLKRLIDTLPSEVSLVMSSDHGNMENLSQKMHTLNDVPLFAKGPASKHLSEAESIEDIAGGILDTLG